MARYSLVVLKVPLNTNQPTNLSLCINLVLTSHVRVDTVKPSPRSIIPTNQSLTLYKLTLFSHVRVETVKLSPQSRGSTGELALFYVEFFRQVKI